MNHPRKVHLIGYVWPEPTSSAAGLRDLHLIRIFREQGWKVSMSSGSAFNEFSEALVAQGVEVFSIGPNDPRFDEVIREVAPDYVVFDRFVTEEQFGWRVREVCPDAIRVLDTQDLHFLRRARMRALKNARDDFSWTELPEDLKSSDAVREVASIYRSDLTLILSDFEMDLLDREFEVPAELLSLFRFCYDPPSAELPAFGDREHFVMIGNFRHPPNRDAVFWLQQKLWPEIRARLPGVEVHLYGAYPPKEIMALNDPARGFRVQGWAKDQYEVLKKYRVNLAPLRFGAGIKGKIADGWWCGTPVVTTPIGSEGMTDGGAWSGERFPGIVASSVEQIVEGAVCLYADAGEWEKKRSLGISVVQELFSHHREGPRLVAALEGAKRQVAERRARNFTGQMLWHHSLASTKYFSKWIEAKNSVKA